MSIKEKMKTAALAATLAASTLSTARGETKTAENIGGHDKYKRTVVLQNDSVLMVGGSAAHYSQDEDRIIVKKGDISWDDFGFENTGAPKDEGLVLVHEAQHQINAKKGIGSADMSLNEDYNRGVHNEISALIAEKLEIRRRYKEAKTEKERKAVLESFAGDADNAEYANAIKEGKIDPCSQSSKDFLAEMAFIKDSSIRYRADANDDAYKRAWTANSMAFLSRRGENVRPNPEAFKREVEAMYHIGGFDFNTVGNKDLILLNNQSIVAADNMLAAGVDVNKLLKFMKEGEGPYKIAETLDLAGLSKKQAEIALLTAIVCEENAMGVAEALCLGEEPKVNFFNGEYDGMGEYLRNQIAPYMDLKLDFLEKSGMLSKDGDEAKFESQLKAAKTFKLDPKAWYDLMKNNLRADGEERKQILERIKQYQGQEVLLDDVAANMGEFALPFDVVSLEATLAEKALKEKRDADFLAEYYKDNPQKRRMSEEYTAQIMDLESDILKDELKALKEQEERVEPLYQQKIDTYMPLGDGMNVLIKTPEYHNAELKKTVDSEGNSISVALVDGKKHGAEVVMANDGRILGYKVYDHGVELDGEKNNIEVSQTSFNGASALSVTLNGEKFGAEIVTGADGKTKAAFFEQGGILMQGANGAKISKQVEEAVGVNFALREELKAQEGEMPNSLAGTSQGMRIDMRLKARPDEASGAKKTQEAEKGAAFSPGFGMQNER